MSRRQRRPSKKDPRAEARALLASLPKFSETMLDFAKPLLEVAPPELKLLRSLMVYTVIAWNLPIYEQRKHPRAAWIRAGFDTAMAGLPPEIARIILAMEHSRLTKYARDPRTGFVVRAALGRKHDVTAFARSPNKLALEHVKLTKLRGDFHDRASVDGAVTGHDAVVITASAKSVSAFKENPNYFSQGTALVIAAMKSKGVRRLVVLSALGVGESRKLVGFLLDKVMIGWLLKVPFEDHARQERMAQESGLEWVIARPSRLTNGPARGRYVKETALKPVPGSISRGDVADFLVQATEVDTWVGKAVQLGG